MIDPQTGIGKRQLDPDQAQATGPTSRRFATGCGRRFPAELYAVATWRDKQGPLLAAVEMETAMLNILLFLIIAVAGFGILAIFFMIVVEKTRDIGILKSLGARAARDRRHLPGLRAVLGLVGAGAGLALGLVFVWNINTIRAGVEWLTGQPVFDPSIYYFYKIPTIVDPVTVAWIVAGRDRRSPCGQRPAGPAGGPAASRGGTAA